MGLPNELNLLIPYDIGVVVYLALFCLLVGRTSRERAAEWARRGEPSDALILIIVNVLAVASLLAVAAMLNHPPGRPRGEISLHMTVLACGDPLLVPGPRLFWTSLHASLL